MGGLIVTNLDVGATLICCTAAAEAEAPAFEVISDVYGRNRTRALAGLTQRARLPRIAV
jgi:hypothetical protein